ncbi:hypothetical protein ACJVC5_15510 [Peredibacter sp. HCB2-198]|uniref:hypothetical protein n=1 Tax=Peredibacter sp. HCB2-198 TaxID=3383025 RepID=UPI0038B433F5
MKLFLSFLISFFFIFSATNLDLPGVADKYFKLDQKNAVHSRTVAPQKVFLKKQLHPGSGDLKFLSAVSAVLLKRHFFLAKYNFIEVSNFISSGAKIYQDIASA